MRYLDSAVRSMKKMMTRDTELKKTLLLCLLLALPVVLIPSIAITVGAAKLPAPISRAVIPEVIPSRVAAHPEPITPREKSIPPVYGMLHTRPNVGYSKDVIDAMRAMGLGVNSLDMWIARRPGSALNKLKYMSEKSQRSVAATAAFITKINPKIGPQTAWREAAALAHYSMKYGVPSALATAVAHTESTFDPNAVSKKGASGVMQVMYRLHDALLTANGIVGVKGKNPLADPEQAIAAGCLLLSRYLRAYGSVANAMERYYGAASQNYRRKIDRSLANLMWHHAAAKVR